jgi:hypothetical protein
MLRGGSNAGSLACLSEPLEFFAPPSLAGLLVIGLPPHLFAEPAALTELAETTNGILNRLAGANP